MFTNHSVLSRILALASIIVSLASFTGQVYAQQRTSVGTNAKTRPYTLVYKLKQQQNARISDASLQQALQKIGAQGTKRKFPNLAVQANARKTSAPEISRIYQLTYSPDISFEKAKNMLLATGLVEYVEPLYERTPFHQPNDPAADSTKTTQYYLKLINAYEGWAVEQGSDDVVIGVLDTGLRFTHQDLAPKIKRNESDPLDGIDNDSDGYVDNYEGWDFADNDNNASDDTATPAPGHGTAVAGVASAATNNSTGMAGVSYNIKFMPLKIFPTSASGGFGGFEAIVYAADKGCKVINLSWGGEGYSQYEQDVINYAVLEKNAVVVAAAGNTAGYIDYYPASYDNVLSVGGTDSKDIKYFGYTHSYNIDLAAPSLNVYTTSGLADNGYGKGNGTSFGTPLVAACAALVRSKYPELNARQVMERLRVSSDDIYTLPENQPYLEMIGKGRVNLKKALKLQNLKSARCTSFELIDKYTAIPGATAGIKADFVNFLAPTSGLEVTLTSNSPYVTITKDKLALGSLGTMAAVNAGTEATFSFSISADVPVNHTVAFRLGFKDGNYEDFQSFILRLNPDYTTLDANNLKVTLNSKGNLGYNGFQFSEGDGVTYKGGSPMLFEGGLLIAASSTQVSDNLRSQMWYNDEDFISTSITKRHLSTPLATQEVRHVMHDNHTAPDELNVGVQVKQIAYAWDSPGNENYIVLEYHIKNTTPEPLSNLHAGLFADWDIGEYYLNAAGWDEEAQLGYAHHVSSALPYAGIRLLSGTSPSYYAIDNMGAYDDDLVIEDDFTSEEKYKTLANGIARTSAGSATGSNISHVVGAKVTELAPGETKIVAFALLAADNLEALKSSALAAQQKYNSFRTSRLPEAKKDTLCLGGSIIWTPEGGTKFNFYADEQKTEYLGNGAFYTVENLSQQTTVYAASVDSLFESAAVPGTFSLPKTPVADFEVEENIYAGSPTSFINKSINAKDWRWNLEAVEPLTDKDLIYTFDQPGSYNITLTVDDRFNCTETSVTKTIEVKASTPTATPESLIDQLQVYPNPTTGRLYLKLKDAAKKSINDLPKIIVRDLMGRTVHVPVSGNASTATADLSHLADGVYLVHFNYEGKSMMKRVVVMKP